MAPVLAVTATALVALASSAGLLAHLERRPAPPARLEPARSAPEPDGAPEEPRLPDPDAAEPATGAGSVATAAPDVPPGPGALGWRSLWWVPAVSVSLAVVLALLWRTPDLELVYQVRVVLFLSFLPALAVIDHRERIVPNQILLVLLALRVPLWIWEALVDVDVFLATLRAEAAMALVIFGFFFLMRAVHRGGLGMGDVKLFALMPLFLGTQLALSAILGSLVAAFAFAVWSLATRRKGRKDTFAMVPAIAVGAILAVLAVSIRGAL